MCCSTSSSGSPGVSCLAGVVLWRLTPPLDFHEDGPDLLGRKAKVAQIVSGRLLHFGSVLRMRAPILRMTRCLSPWVSHQARVRTSLVMAHRSLVRALITLT